MFHQRINIDILDPGLVSLLDIATYAPPYGGGQIAMTHIITALDCTIVKQDFPKAAIRSLQLLQAAQDRFPVQPLKGVRTISVSHHGENQQGEVRGGKVRSANVLRLSGLRLGVDEAAHVVGERMSMRAAEASSWVLKTENPGPYFPTVVLRQVLGLSGGRDQGKEVKRSDDEEYQRYASAIMAYVWCR